MLGFTAPGYMIKVYTLGLPVRDHAKNRQPSHIIFIHWAIYCTL
jgi:hypothetical protein